MLRVRREQLAIMEGLSPSEQHRELVAYATHYFPPHAQQLGPEGLATVITSVMERATSFGCVGLEEHSLFLIPVFVFGDAFPQAERFEWARAHLRDESMPMAERLRRVVSQTLETLRALASGGAA